MHELIVWCPGWPGFGVNLISYMRKCYAIRMYFGERSKHMTVNYVWRMRIWGGRTRVTYIKLAPLAIIPDTKQ